MSEQLTLDIPGLPPLEVEPTPAMLRGEQHIVQCSWCGTVVVVSGLASASAPLGRCPVQHAEPSSWWRQELPLAGLREVVA